MQAQRQALVGAPHTYYLTAECVLSAPLLAQDLAEVCAFIESWRQLFDLQCFAFAIEGHRYHLVIHHQEHCLDAESQLARRWQQWGGRPSGRSLLQLRERMVSLSAIMQTFAQHYSRRWHQRHGGHGSLWACRYRACLLCDDSALTAACAACHHGVDAPRRSDPHHGTVQHGIQLTPLPLLRAPGGEVWPQDEAPLGLLPPTPAERPTLYDDFIAPIDHESLMSYRQALAHGWALGQPHSLVDCLARLGRSHGRGRSRRIRELNDALGLCGLWG